MSAARTTRYSKRTKRLVAVGIVVAAAGIAAGCGSDDDTVSIDSFTKYVKSLISTSDDTATPTNVDNVMVTASDTDAPTAVY